MNTLPTVPDRTRQVSELMTAFGALTDQLEHALEAHHDASVVRAADCDVCREFMAAVSQCYEQVDAVLRRIAAGQ